MRKKRRPFYLPIASLNPVTIATQQVHLAVQQMSAITSGRASSLDRAASVKL
jgi:hypothetical protein